MTGFPINPPRAQIVDGRGFVSNEWYRYFSQIQTAVGSAASASWQDGYLLVPPSPALISVDLLEEGAADRPVAVRNVSSDTSLFASDSHLRCNASASPLSVILPLSGTCTGRKATIKKVDASANAVTIVCEGGELIDGAASLSIGTSMQAYTLISNGLTGWDII